MHPERHLEWLLSLPDGEDDRFDRKAFTSVEDLRRFIGKSVSAFANSGGGTVVLGQNDDRTIDGVPRVIRGRQTAREWLGQVAADSVVPALHLFHISVIEYPEGTADDRVVLVLDIGDSPEAPHQCARDHIYYRRTGEQSLPAPHFYLELLRQRQTAPKLDVIERESIAVGWFAHEDCVALVGCVRTKIANRGERVACGVVPRYECRTDTPLKVLFDQELAESMFRIPGPRFAAKVFPLGVFTLSSPFVVSSSEVGRSPEAQRAALAEGLPSLDVSCRLVSEVHVGESEDIEAGALFNEGLVRSALQLLIPYRATSNTGHAGWGIDYDELEIELHGRTIRHVSTSIVNKSEFNYDSVRLAVVADAGTGEPPTEVEIGGEYNLRSKHTRRIAFAPHCGTRIPVGHFALRVLGVEPAPSLELGRFPRDEDPV